MTPQANPYASPSEDAQRQHSIAFTLDDEQRKVISGTATVMVIAGVVQLLVMLMSVVRAGLSVESAVVATLFGVVPSFMVVAGLSLRQAAAKGSMDALLSGFRQLFVVFLVKGVVLLLFVVGGLLSLLLFALGVGFDLFS